METLGDILAAWQIGMAFNDSEAARYLDLGVEHYWRIKRNQRTNLRPETLTKISTLTGFPEERLVVAAALGRHRNREVQAANT